MTSKSKLAVLRISGEERGRKGGEGERRGGVSKQNFEKKKHAKTHNHIRSNTNTFVKSKDPKHPNQKTN